MKRSHWIMGLIGLLLLSLSVWQILAAAQGLEVTTLHSSQPPLTVMIPEGTADESRPVVLVGHGFAGSTAVMRGFGLTLAHAGYQVVLWDFDGHGANPRPLPSDGLEKNAETALKVAEAQRLINPAGIAILGHSMGSGVALTYGMTHPETAVTILVSPVDREVTPDLPRNLLLMAGSLETRFADRAEDLLAEAGGPRRDPAAGTGRKLVIIPGVEHISILFSPATHAAARDWLDATFSPQPGASDYTDRRVLWYALEVLGAFLIGAALAPLVAESSPATKSTRPLWHRLAAMAGGSLGATLLLWLVGQVGLELHETFGLLVGGYIILWFGIAGILSLLLLWERINWPSWSDMLGGLMAFAVLWLGVGLVGQSVWQVWLLIPPRLKHWPLSALLLLPWFLAFGKMTQGVKPLGRMGWWLGCSAALAGGLFLALRITPGLGFIMILIPLFPIILGFHALAAAPHRRAWPFALSGALFVSWLLLAVFPLQ